ncbi:MAG: hypothetical protein K2L16_02880 [Muribaculaceae bacterium]|nr:hypothetical protein [Muribaculaceae bacterium]
MRKAREYERIADFQVKIDGLEAGWETVSLLFDGTEISFNASYIGAEPLSSLIEAVEALNHEYCSGSDDSQYFIDWVAEPGCMGLALKHNMSDDLLSMDIRVSKSEDINDDSAVHRNFAMNYSLFRRAVVDAAISALNKYGICGFNQNWDVDNDVLPFGSLLSILGTKTYFDKGTRSLRSDLKQEIALLTLIASSEAKRQ